MVVMVEYELVKRRLKEPLQRSCSFNAYDLGYGFGFIAKKQGSFNKEGKII